MAKKTRIIIEELTDEEVAAEQQAQPVTLADVPDRIHCLDEDGDEVFHINGQGYYQDMDGAFDICCADHVQVLSRLDGQPLPTKTKPLPKTLADCPAGHVYVDGDGDLLCRLDGCDWPWKVVEHVGGWGAFGTGFSTQNVGIVRSTNLRLTVKTEGGEA